MIILSQDKEIINFDNVTRVFIEDFSEEGEGFGIGADTNSTERQCWELGTYETYERAYDIKRQIEEAYINCELIKIPRMDFEGIITSAEIAKNLRFEMPEE